jgi:peroxiredoxin
MKVKGKAVLIFIVLIGLLGLFLFIFKGPGPKVDYVARVGQAAPDFELPSLGGQSVRLSDYRGKVVFLNIWASWCPPCRQEMPSMEALYNRLKDRRFKMLAVSLDRGGEEDVRPFIARFGLTFPVLLDPENKTFKLYGLTGVPETFIVDKKGVVANKIIGPQDWMSKEWLDYFERLIR